MDGKPVFNFFYQQLQYKDKKRKILFCFLILKAKRQTPYYQKDKKSMSPNVPRIAEVVGT